MSGLSYYFYNKHDRKQKMIMMNNWPFHDEVLRYVCMKYKDEIDSFNYSVEKDLSF